MRLKLFYRIIRYFRNMDKEYSIFEKYNTSNMLEKQNRMRQAHILEKGLRRHDFEKGHSVGIYKSLKAATENEELTDEVDRWIKHQIIDYEKAQEDKPREKYIDKNNLALSNSPPFLQVVEHRRSVRYFKEKIVSSELLMQFALIAQKAPSSCNRQPLRIYATNNPEKSKQVASCFAGFTCFGEFIPVAIVFTAYAEAYDYPFEILLPYIDVSLGVENFLLAAAAEGIQFTMLSWASHKKEDLRKLREILDIPNNEIIVVGVVGGYPDELESCIPRLPLKSIFFMR